jgi:hypothetical protein
VREPWPVTNIIQNDTLETVIVLDWPFHQLATRHSGHNFFRQNDIATYEVCGAGGMRRHI